MRARRAAFILATSVAALIVLLLVGVHTPVVVRFVEGRIEEQLRNAGIAFRADEFSYNLLAGTVRIRNVTLTSVQHPGLPPFLTASEIDANLDMTQIITSGVVVENATAKQLAIHIYKEEDGDSNLPQSDDSGGGSEQLPAFVIRNLDASGSFVLDDRQNALNVRLPLWTLGVNAASGEYEHAVRFELPQPGNVRAGERELVLDSLTTNGQFNRDRIRIDQLRLAAVQSTIQAGGTITGYNTMKLDLQATTNLELEPLARIAGIEQDIDGQFEAAIRATGPAAKPLVVLESSTLTALDAEIHATATFNGVEESDTNQVQVEIARLDLPQLTRRYDLPTNVTSTVAGTVQASFPGTNFQALQANAELRLQPILPGAPPDRIPVAGTINARLIDDRVTVTTNNLTALGVQARANVSMNMDEPRALSGQVNATIANLGSLVEQLQGPQEQPVGGTVELALRLSGTADRPVAAANITGDDLRYGQIQGATLRAEASYRPERAAVSQAVLSWSGAEVTANGTVDLQGRRNLAFQARTEAVPIQTILQAAGQQADVNGNLSLQAVGSGTLDNPEIGLDLQAADLVAYQEPLGVLTAKASLIGQTLTIPALRLEKPEDSGVLTAQGSYNLETRAYDVQAQGENIVLRQAPVRGTIDLALNGQGTIDNPAANFELHAADVQAEGRTIGAVDLTGRVENQIARINAAVPDLSLKAEGQIGTSAPYPATFDVAADGTQVEKLQAEMPGQVSMRAHAEGNLENWRQGSAQVEVSNVRLETQIGEVTNDGPIRASYANETLRVESARIRAPQTTVELHGALPGTLTYKGAADLAALEQVDASGQLNFAGEVTGNFERITPTGTVTLADGQIRNDALTTPVQNIQLDVALENGMINIRQLQAGLGAGTVQGQGTVPLGLFSLPEIVNAGATAGPAQFQLQANNIDLKSLTAFPQDGTGLISVNVQAQASRPEIEALTAKATFDQLNLQLGGMNLSPAATPTITLANGVATIEQFDLQGTGSRLRLSGAASLTEKELRNVQVSGNFDAALLRLASSELTAGGEMRLQVTANGSFSDPALNGGLTWENGVLAVPSPRIQATDLDLRVTLDNHQIAIERLNGDLNGGTLDVSGSLQLNQFEIENPQLRIRANNVYLDYPAGLRTLSTTDLALRPEGDFLLLGGTARIQEGSYTDLIDITELTRYLRNRGGVELVEERNPLLSRLRFDIDVSAENPIVIDNNLGELAIDVDVNVLGNVYRPGLTGRVTIEEGGKLTLQENEYLVEQGVISFVNEARIEPSLNLVATTDVLDRHITMSITGTADDLQTNLTSDNPNDTRADIIALLLTGRTAEGLQGRELTVASEQVALSLLGGTVTGRLSRGLENTLGLSQVRVQPNLISAESDPSARLTLGQDITNELELIYSMDLTDSNDQIWIVDYDVTRRFTARGTKQQDNSYRFDIQHDLQFGQRRPVGTTAPRAERRVGMVTFTGNLALPVERIDKEFGVNPGDRYDFFKLRDELDDVENFYRDQNHLEARVRLNRRGEGDTVDLNINVEAGPQVRFAYEAWEPSGGVRKNIREIWQRGVFDTHRLQEAADALRVELYSDGYLQAKIETDVREPEPNQKQVLFLVDRGERYRGAEIVFDGASGIEPDTLKDNLEEAELADQILVDPTSVSDFLTDYYRQEGFLNAEVSAPRFEFNQETGRGVIRIPIDEGPDYKFGQFTFSGEQALTEAELREATLIDSGAEYTPLLAQDAHDRMEEAYWKKGYRDVVINLSLTPERQSGTVNIAVNIEENLQSIVSGIEVEGTNVLDENFVRRQLELTNGSILDYTKTTASRRNLYNTGAFTSVELMPRPADDGISAAPGTKNVRLVARVQERVPYELRYGGFYDTDRGPGVIADFTNRNSLGGGRVVGARGRWDADVREVRAYFSQPLLRSLPIRTDVSSFRRRELREAFITDRTGATVQQEFRLRNSWVLNYGYRFEYTHTFDRDPDVFLPFDETVRIAPLTATLTRDTRDEVLDAARGSFSSHALEYSTTKLGSSLQFARYFGQYFRYIPLAAPAEVPFGGAVKRPRLIYAGGVRIGLAGGLGGQELLPSERFFAGGGTTIRGFEQDAVGPLDFFDRPAGGNAVFIVNNELRFPIFSLFEGVAFVDLGNVYARIADFDPTDIRKTGGFGLRVRTPYFLLRGDYGVKFDRRTGESRGEFFFSIGQAF